MYHATNGHATQYALLHIPIKWVLVCFNQPRSSGLLIVFRLHFPHYLISSICSQPNCQFMRQCTKKIAIAIAIAMYTIRQWEIWKLWSADIITAIKCNCLSSYLLILHSIKLANNIKVQFAVDRWSRTAFIGTTIEMTSRSLELFNESIRIKRIMI